MTKIGYARVSTREQKDDSQIDELLAAGCDPDHLFVDHGVSGKLAKRPQLDACLAYLREGDTLVITRLSRAMRSLHHLLDMVNGTRSEDGERQGGLRQRGINLVVLKQDIDTSSPGGRLLFHILAAIDEFQRELIVEGTKEGLAAARARGKVGGRKAKLSDADVTLARELYDRRDRTVQQIADHFHVDRRTHLPVPDAGSVEARAGVLVHQTSSPHAVHRPPSTAPAGCLQLSPDSSSICSLAAIKAASADSARCSRMAAAASSAASRSA